MSLEQIPFLSEAIFPQAIRDIESRLTKLQHHGYFTNRENQKLYYEYFLAPGSHRSVVVVHGLSEFTKKYCELTWYLLAAGYNVFLYDQRGHGRSFREADRPELIHLHHFEDLVRDLEDYIQSVVLPANPGTLYLYAHSMGGAVGLLHLAEHPDRFRRALISSPLMLPVTNGIPAAILRLITGLQCAMGLRQKKFRFSGEYTPDKPYIHTPGDSESRVRHCLTWRDRHPEYRSTPMTIGCVYSCLRLKRQLLRKKVAKSIRTPVLMLCAENDTLVRKPPQAAFAKKCPRCRRLVLPGTNHCLLTNQDWTVRKVVELTLEHFEMM